MILARLVRPVVIGCVNKESTQEYRGEGGRDKSHLLSPTRWNGRWMYFSLESAYVYVWSWKKKMKPNTNVVWISGCLKLASIAQLPALTGHCPRGLPEGKDIRWFAKAWRKKENEKIPAKVHQVQPKYQSYPFLSAWKGIRQSER